MATRISKSIVFSTPYLSLPCDIPVNHIFLKLPFKSLLSCKCVCKEWHRLLTDSYFIHLHHKHQKMNNNQKLLLGQIFYKEGLPGDSKDDYEAKSAALHGAFYSIHVQPSEEAADAVRLRGISLDLYGHFIVSMVGCCNGMVCMLVCNLLVKERNTIHILTGNPSTGHYKILPEVSFPQLVGFCYVSSLDDYKVVMIDRDTRIPHIFSLKLNSWRVKLDSSDNGKIKYGRSYLYCNLGIAFDRSIYWLVQSSKVIIGFDLIDEEFTEFPLPFDMWNGMSDDQLYMTMSAAGGSLCIANAYLDKHVVDLWLMLKHEGNNKNRQMTHSWCMLMKVDLSDFAFVRISPLSFMKSGKLLCRSEIGAESDSFVLIDPKTQRVETFTILDETGADWLQQVTFRDHYMGYIDSLVSPN